jgi:hypothetical protein
MEFTLAPMAKDFLPYSIDQKLLLPPDMRDWLPPSHTSRRSARGRVGFRRTTTYGMGSSRGAAALPSNVTITTEDRRSFCRRQKPDGLLELELKHQYAAVHWIGEVRVAARVDDRVSRALRSGAYGDNRGLALLVDVDHA